MATTHTEWQSLSVSVLGAKHERQGRVCEDFSDDEVTDSGVRIVALSDGHGTDDAPRSDRGARFAVESAIEVIKKTFSDVRASEEESGGDENVNGTAYSWMFSLFGSQDSQHEPPSEAEKVFRRELEGNSRLVRRVIKKWQDRVRGDIQSATDEHQVESRGFDFDDGEDEACDHTDDCTPSSRNTDRSIARKEWNDSKPDFEAYGATLLVAVAAPTYRFFFQIGDGDIIKIPSSPEDNLTDLDDTWVLPQDEHLGEETYSLSMERPERHARTKFVSSRTAARSESPFLFLSTDGYRNSFVDDDGFVEAVRDFRDLMLSDKAVDQEATEDRHDAILERMGHWMKEASQNGSGDDISIGILYDSSLTGSTDTHLDLDTE